MEDKMVEFFLGGQLTYLDFGRDVNLNLIIMEDIESRN